MRLGWVRALPRRLWGGPGDPELCRSFCQRPAQVPAEGGDTSRGDTSRGDTSRGDTSRGDTSGSDTSGGDTWGTSAWLRRFRKTRDGDGDPQDRDPHAGDPRDTSGGDTSGGDTSEGATPRSPSRRLRSRGTHGDHQEDPRGAGAGGGPGDTGGRGDTGGHSDTGGHNDTGGRGDTGGQGDTGGRGASGGHSASGGHGASGGQGDTGRHHDTGGRGASGGPAAFEAALRELSRAPPGRGGRLALVEAALAAMPALGVQRSRAAYHALLRLLPRGPWVPRGPVQRLLFPFPRQQESGVRLLEQMERYGVLPDAETCFLLLGVFGPRSRPVRKVQRMLFWLPRFRQLDPHPLPPELPPPGLGTARLALRRIAGDPGATVTVIQQPVPDTGEEEGSVQPYIVSSQSPEQRELLARHDPARPVFVEGPFPLWLRGTRLSYFVLRGDPLAPHLREPPPDPERSFYFPLELELELERGPWDRQGFDVDEVEEGPVFALCMAGTPDRRSLGRWIAALQLQNPVLGRAPVVFRLSPGGFPPPGPPEPPQTPQLGPGSPPAAALEPPEGRDGRGDPERSSRE